MINKRLHRFGEAFFVIPLSLVEYQAILVDSHQDT